METHKILDRFEMLFPLNSKVADLRRACIDKDLHSVFRLIKDDTKEDLRKIIMEDNQWSLWKILDMYVDTRFVQSLKSFEVYKLKWDEDCFSQGQIKSKLWLLHELQKTKLDLGTVFICAGWYGTLATMIFESKLNVNEIRSFDNDPSCLNIAEIFNKPWVMEDWKFKPATYDIHDIDYNSFDYSVIRTNGTECKLTSSPDTIINTSCEHITNFDKWYDKIPNGKLVILQGNDYFELDEHINCSADQDSFSEKAPMTDVLYLGTIDCDKYKRFMKIGIR
tara:strand:- start:485 stop:1321 length:837 start_codon:yes stop_codon:yes gene_type:complete